MTITVVNQDREERQHQPLLRRFLSSADATRVGLLVVLLWVVAVALWAAVLPTFGQLPAPLHLTWPVLALLFFAAERFIVDLEVREQTHSFSLSEVALLLALVFAAPVDLLIGQAIGASIALALRHGQRPIKLLFNLANFGVSSAVALIVFRTFLGAADPLSMSGWLAALAAAVSSDLVALTSVALVIGLSERARPNLRSLFGVGTIYTLVAPGIALLAAIVLWHAPTAVWLLLVLGAMAYVMLRFHGREISRHQSVSRLHESTRRIQESFRLDDVARALLSTAREMFDAEMAELLLFGDDGGDGRQMRLLSDSAAEAAWTDVTLDPREGVWARVAAEGRGVVLRDTSTASPAAVAIRTWLRRLVTNDSDTADRVVAHFRARGIRGAMVAPLRVDEGVVGTLLVGNRRGSVVDWSSADLTMIETLANHAAVALQNSRQADELADQRDELERRSTHDDLTGMANRAMFYSRLKTALEGGRSGAVLVLDLDHFKEINDTLGHHNGDKLLIAVAERLTDIADHGFVVARLGGDEFAVLAVDDARDAAHATSAATRILGLFKRPFQVQGLTLQVEPSIGISLFPEHGRDANTLMRRADVAMYHAKGERTHFAVYEQQRDPYSEARLALMGELRKAIERGELSVVYQPQAEAASGRIVSFEALVRWHHAQRGDIPPDEFVALAERSELIHGLTRFVLGAAVAQCAEWRAAGFDVRVAVNLSARSLHDVDLAADTDELLKRHALAPAALELEITETGIESDPAASEALLERLHDMGIEIAIDDFGTGYSAFSYLQRLPIDEIKIDRSFVAGMDTDHRQRQIVRSTIQLGHNLDLRVVAEGVESAAIEGQLKKLGCDVLQGYHISRPISADMATGLLRRPRARAPSQPPRLRRMA